MKDQFSDSIGNLTDKLMGWLNAIVKMIPNFILAILVMVVAYFVAKYVAKILGKLVAKKVHKKAIVNMMQKVIVVLVLIVGLFVALGILNLSKTVTSLLAGAGVIGLVIGFAVQDSLSDTVSGIIISFRDKIRIGNWVETNGFTGEIIDINLKSFIMKEADNNIVMIPNKSILTNPLKNYSLTPHIRVNVTCGVGYGSDLEMVERLTKETIKNTFKPIEGKEEVEFYFTEFGDSSINFRTRFWIEADRNRPVLEATNKAIIAIKKAFDKADVNIPFPIRTLQFDNRLELNKASES